MKLHPSLAPERIMEAVKRGTFGLDNPGFCVDCGDEAEGCEPDARNYKCQSCGCMSVFGAEELLHYIA